MCCEWLRQLSEAIVNYMQAVRKIGVDSVGFGACGQADATC